MHLDHQLNAQWRSDSTDHQTYYISQCQFWIGSHPNSEQNLGFPRKMHLKKTNQVDTEQFNYKIWNTKTTDKVEKWIFIPALMYTAQQASNNKKHEENCDRFLVANKIL